MDPESGRIDSWKSIANYLHCEETTARRWEKERGLPVRRLKGDKRSGVYAFRHELDEWLAEGRRREAAETATNSSEGAASEVFRASVAHSPDPAFAIPPAAPSSAESPGARRPRALGAAIVLGILGLTGVASRWALEGGRDHPVSLRAEGAILEALDAAGRPLWTRVFSAPFPQSYPVQPLSDRSWIGDLNGDGSPEVLFVAAQPAGDGAMEDTVYCFTSAGRELWSFRLLDTLRFRTGSFGPPWSRGLLAVYDIGQEKRIALAMAPQTWWPAPLLTLNARGERVTTFVSSGLIYQLRAATRGGRALLFAGGVSNSREAASLIVLDGENPVGTTPEEPNSPYQCLTCPAGQPLRYFSFPKTDLTAASKNPYNYTTGVRASGSELVVAVSEPSTVGHIAAHFRFDSMHRLTDARWGDNFGLIHESFEEAGSLRHTAGACPNRVPRARVYEPGHGLVDLPLDTAADR